MRRAAGKLVAAEPAESKVNFTVDNKTFSAVTNPWRADLFTAGISTGIANIDTYSVFPGFIVQLMRGRLLWLRNLMLNHVLRFLPEGPSENQLQQGSTYVTATAKNGEKSATASLKGPEAYLFTVYCLREITKEILGGNTQTGFRTPAIYGKELLERVDGIAWHRLASKLKVNQRVARGARWVREAARFEPDSWYETVSENPYRAFPVCDGTMDRTLESVQARDLLVAFNAYDKEGVAVELGQLAQRDQVW